MACAAKSSIEIRSQQFLRLKEPHLYVALDHFQPLGRCHLRITYSAVLGNARHGRCCRWKRPKARTRLVAEGQQVAGNPQEIISFVDCKIKNQTGRQLVLDEQIHEILGELDLLP